jgi:3-oxoacyl-[acyl-carrier protein] reductase
MATLDGKAAIVTGGTKGIGRAIALALVRAGAAVALSYSGDDDAARDTLARIRQDGGHAVAIRGDVSRPADVRRLFAEARAALGTVDILVNNAAAFRFQPLADVDAEEFRRHFDTNVLGPLVATQEYLKQAPAEGGSIINISSANTTDNPPGSALYTATKGALESLTRVAAAELGPRGIRVNAIAPGLTDTEGSRRVGVIGGEKMAGVIATTPLGRIGRPEEIGSIAVFLASDDARWISGEVLLAAGGRR